MHFRKSAIRLSAVLLTVVTAITPALAATGTVTATTLNIRAEGNTSSAVIGTLQNGAQVEVLGKTDANWYQISVNGGTGYVSGDYLTVAEEVAAAETALAEAAPAEAAPAEAAPAEAAPAEAAAEETAAAPQAQEPFYVKVVAATGLNVRAGASTDTEKVGSLENGSVVKVLEVTNGWYHLENGYISSDYAARCDASEATAPSTANIGQQIADLAKTFVGYPYVYGGSSPRGFDCSGFTSYLYRQFGITINRTASAQMSNGRRVSRNELKPGDIIGFNTHGSGVSHVGLYIGNGQIVHASSPKSGVKINSIYSSYYATRFVAAVRIVE